MIASGTRYGLSAAVFGADPTATAAIADRVEAGMGQNNGATSGADFLGPTWWRTRLEPPPARTGPRGAGSCTRTRTITTGLRSAIPVTDRPSGDVRRSAGCLGREPRRMTAPVMNDAPREIW